MNNSLSISYFTSTDIPTGVQQSQVWYMLVHILWPCFQQQKTLLKYLIPQ